MNALLEEAISAHGGIPRWQALEVLELDVGCGGLAFAMKGHRRFGTRARIFTAGVQRVEFDEHVFTGAEPRPHGLRWSDAEMAAFAGAALWTYVSFPFVLTRPGWSVQELPGRRLSVTVPPGVQSHSRRHVLWIGDDGRIRRHDYTAEAFGRWAKAANVCVAYAEIEGLAIATRRRVTPRAGNRPLPFPTLVSIELRPAGARSAR